MTQTLRILALGAVVGCTAPAATPITMSGSQALTSIVENGSFETGDYTGWTLAESSGQPSFGTWGIATDGQTVSPGEVVFDFSNQTAVQEGSPGLPITYHATDGSFVALQLQNGPENHRMFQTVSMPSCQPLLQWDMDYSNHFQGGFTPDSQYIAVNIRDAETDAVLATPFKTNPGDPLEISTMTPFQVDLTAFSGQTVRIDFEQQVLSFFFDGAYDNIRVVCKGIGALPGSLDFGPVLVDTATPPLPTTITNFANVPLTITAMSIDLPFAVTDGPAMPMTLQPGDSTQVSIAFAPVSSGPITGTLVITSDDPNGSTTVALSGAGVTPAPLLTALPSSLGFGPVRVGATSEPQAIRVDNSGTAPATITAILAGDPFSVIGPEPPFVIPVGSFVTMFVAFSPSAEGPASGQIGLVGDDPEIPLVEVGVSGAGVQPDISLPTEIGFAPQRVGTTSAARLIPIFNTGSDTLTIESFDATGPFAVTGEAGVQVAPGDAAVVWVTFAPTAIGLGEGTLTIVSDAPSSPTLVPLLGTGTGPILAVDTTPLAFGSLRVGSTGTKMVTVGNAGTAPLVVTSATTAAPFSVAPAGPVVVLPGGHANLVVSFAPSATGSASGTLAISSDAGDTEIDVSGTGVQPAISATPSSHDFGDVRVGAASSPVTFSIASSGSDTLHVTAVTLPLGFSSTAPIALPVAIAPGDALSFDVVFAPLKHVSFGSSIAIASDAGPAAIAVAGRGVAPTLVASLDDVPFGAVAIGTTSTLAVQLANTGDAPATIASISVIGSSEFSVDPLTLPAVVPPGGSVTASITFSPTDHGLRSARIVVTSDAPVVSVAVAGTGSGARAVVAPASLDLGSANVADQTAPRSVTVSNTGDVDLAISSIVIAGTAAADFSSPAILPVTVGPGGSTTIAFALAPSAVGARTATATLVTTDPLAPSSQVSLAGVGTSPAIAVAPGSLDFGGVNLGRTIAKTFAVTNTGTGPLSITSIDVGGPDASQLALDPIAMPVVLAPSASKVIHVSFSPTVVATANATVTLLSDDPATPAVAVPIVGVGTSPTVAVTPTDLDFGAQIVGHPSALRQIHVTNLGSGPLVVSSLAITGPQASTFAVVSPPPLPFAIAVSNEVVLSFRVTPAATGGAAAELEIGTNAASATASLTALGVATGLSVSPTSIDFGSTHVPVTVSPVTVTLTNLSADSIQLVDASRSGGRPGDFAVSSVAGVLLPGASTTAVVTYAPTAASVAAATLTFAATDPTVPPALVTVGGKAVSTFVTVDRDALDFGTIELGDHSGPKQVTLTNVTTAPLTIASVVAADPQFIVDAPPGAPILPGQSASFTVAFAPTIHDTTSSTIAITLAGATTPELSVAVSGTGATRTDTASCSATRSASVWLLLAVAVTLRRRRAQRGRTT